MAFGDDTKQAVADLRSRVGGAVKCEESGEEHTSGNMYASLSIKLREGFEDKEGFFEALNKSIIWDMFKAPIPFKPQFRIADGRLIITLSTHVHDLPIEEHPLYNTLKELYSHQTNS